MNFVQVRRTATIENCLKTARAMIEDRTSTLFKQIDHLLQSGEEKAYIPVSVIIEAQKLCRKTSYLHEILSGSDLYVPAYIEPPRNPELQERVERLKAEQANQEYAEMTKNVDLNRRHPTRSPGSIVPDMKSVQGQLITVVNVFLTVLGAFMFGYKAIEYSTGVKNFVLQISVGLFCAFLVAVADVYFLFKRFNKLD